MVPLRSFQAEGDYVYLFNASIIPALKKSEQSGALIRSYVSTIKKIRARGKASVTVPSARITAWPVSVRVGNANNDDAELVRL
jgi:hypothetical protein